MSFPGFLLGAWEYILFFAVTALAYIAWENRKAWQMIGAFLIVWLVTALFYPLLTGFHARNNAGSFFLTDPWDPLFKKQHWPLLFHWWIWFLLFATIVAGIVGWLLRNRSFAGKLETVTRVLGGILLVLALIGIDWLDPIHSAFPSHPKAAVAARTCKNVISDYNDQFGQYQTINNNELSVPNGSQKSLAYQQQAFAKSGDLAKLRDELGNRRCQVPPTSVVAKFTVTTTPGSLCVKFDASGSVGTNLLFSVHTGDTNNSDDQPQPATSATSFPYCYRAAGTYISMLTATDMYTRHDTVSASGPVTVTDRVKAAASAPKPKPTAKAKPATCSTWTLKSGDHAHYRLAGGGLAAILHASSDKAALSAVKQWEGLVRTDKANLSAAALTVLQDGYAPSAFVTGNCASNTAVEVYDRIKQVLANAVVTVSKAPAGLYNDGIYQGHFVRAAKPGLHGNRRALKVVTDGGRTFWILARSGNPVVPETISSPVGKTDN